MKIVIEISNKDIPKHQEIIDIRLHFIDGHVVDADGYGFEEIPKGCGRLIDADAYAKRFDNTNINGRIGEDYIMAPTIIEPSKEN